MESGSKRPKPKLNANAKRGKKILKVSAPDWRRKRQLVQTFLAFLLISSFFEPPSVTKCIDMKIDVFPADEPAIGGLTALALNQIKPQTLQNRRNSKNSHGSPSNLSNVSVLRYSSSDGSNSPCISIDYASNQLDCIGPDASNGFSTTPPDALEGSLRWPPEAPKEEPCYPLSASKSVVASKSLSAFTLSAKGPSLGSEKVASNEQLSFNNMPVNIRLKDCVGFWYKFCSDLFILDIINNGYKLPFITTPCTIELNNNRTAFNESKFVTNEITTLLSKGYIKKVSNRPHVINPLSVAFNSQGKRRLILDLRHVNKHLFKFCVKYEAFDVLKNYITKGGFMVKFDLKSGYHHINIFEEHQTFLGFSWFYQNTKSYFIFTVLPFGLATACNVFTKFMRPLISRWRGLGIKIIVYLDDGIVTNSSSQILGDQALLIKKDLRECGFSLNDEKCVWQPTDYLEWLGLYINLETFEFVAPSRKVDKLIVHLNKALNSLYSTPRLLAQLVGFIVSLKLAIGPKAIFFTRYMQIAIKDSVSWNQLVQISDSVRTEMKFWNIVCHKKMLSYPINEQKCGVNALSIYTDASGTGGGGFIKEIPNSEVYFQWDYEDQNQSSTYRELKALYLVVQKLSFLVKNREILWHTDNQNCVRIINFGSMTNKLHSLANCINSYNNFHSIKLFPIWIPRALNSYADGLSKLSNNSDWSVDKIIFDYFNKIWGPFTFDRFADNNNTKCQKFNSLKDCINSLGINSFNYDWSNDNNWLVPPIDLISRTILHMKECKAKGVLVVPKWPSSYFWPTLANDEGFYNFIIDHVEYIKPKNFFSTRRNNFFAGELKFNILVLRIDCSSDLKF